MDRTHRTAARTCAALIFTTVLSVATSASAQYIYIFGGQNFDTVTDREPPQGTFATTLASVEVQLELSSPITPNMPMTDLRPLLVSYSFTKKHIPFTVTEEDHEEMLELVTDVSGDPNGLPAEWHLSWTGIDPRNTGEQSHQIRSAHRPGDVLDSVNRSECLAASQGVCTQLQFDSGEIANAPGTWTIGQPAPGLGLIGTVLLGVSASVVATRFVRRPEPRSTAS